MFRLCVIVEKGQPESLNWSMANRKKRKGKTMIYKTIHTKIKDRGTRTPLKTWDEHGYYSVNDAPTSKYSPSVFKLSFHIYKYNFSYFLSTHFNNYVPSVCYCFIFILLYTFVVSVLHQRKKWSIFVKYYLCTRGKSNISSFSFALLNKNRYI
jgi:hypothetical protein